MKINMKSKNATSNKNAAKKVITPKAAKAAKQSVKAEKKAAKVVATGQMIALLSGERGLLCRKVETGMRGTTPCIRALQNEKGLALDGEWAELHDGKLTAQGASRVARVQLGGYVNGRNTGATVKLVKESEFTKQAKTGEVKWHVDNDSTACTYLGDANVKGIVAVKAGSFYWQAEQDSNSNNKHERATVIVKNAKTKAAK